MLFFNSELVLGAVPEVRLDAAGAHVIVDVMTKPESPSFAAHFHLQVAGGGQEFPVHAVYCIGRNYAEHAKELGNQVPTLAPVVFLKSPAALRSILATPERAPLAFAAESFHHELEIVILVGKPLALGQDGSWDLVAGIALGIDLTRRTVQTELKAKGLPWTTAKSFAGSGLLGPFVPPQRFPDVNAISFNLTVNGETRQTGNSRDMIFSVPSLLSYLAQLHPLVPGDLIYTGTPAGVGPVKQGDKLSLSFLDLGASYSGVL